ncbi:MAG: DUF3810 domain-containing protein [Oscillospiraceae bacterium]|nr:DUF3810 domain-containing protein [Oscillospiraceae bacterium]
MKRLSVIIRKFWVFIPFIAAALMFLLLPIMPPEVTEYVFSRGLFKAVTVPVGFITSFFFFSLTELLVILAVPLVALIVFLLVRKVRKREDKSEKKKILLKAGKTFCGFLSFACLMYMICHGANYYRLPLEKTMDLDTSPKSAELLLEVCRTLANEAKAASENLGKNADGSTKLSESYANELKRAGNGYDKLVGDYPFLWTSVNKQKPVMLSEAWSYTHITGMYFPFFAECNVNIAQPDYLIPATAAHESAHSRGIAFENECNFLAFLSCINSDYPEYRYSGYMLAFTYCSNELDYEMWVETNSLLNDRMRADLSANSRYIYDHSSHGTGTVVDEIVGTVNEVSHSANDAFITIQGVEDGVRSYNRVTELILAYYSTRNS